MKKFLMIATLLMGVAVAQAQEPTLQGTKFTDNWSVTLKGGAVMPFQHFAFWPSARGAFGIEVRKQITPIIGVGLEGAWSFNTSSWFKDGNPYGTVWGPKSTNIIDHQLVGMFGTVNFANLFARYQGAPRLVEIEGVLGAGWWHGYKHIPGGTYVPDENSWYTKAGLNINFNLLENKALTLSFKPSVVWDMNGDAHEIDRKATKAQQSHFNANHANVELMVGVTYHFANSNGTHHFALCDKKYTQSEMDDMNAQVNALRAAKANSDAEAARLAAERDQLRKQLEDCQKLKTPAPAANRETIIVNHDSEALETNVFFAQGKSVVTAAQMPNVERVATYMKNHKDSKVTIRGYASPEGSQEINERLANARANAVKDLLVKKYKIAADRIDAKGLGVGDMFSEPDWNRVSVCYIITRK